MPALAVAITEPAVVVGLC